MPPLTFARMILLALPPLGALATLQLQAAAARAGEIQEPAAASAPERKTGAKVQRLVEAGEAEIPVFVLLRSQPQRQVLEEQESRHAERWKPAEARFAELLRTARENDPVVSEAREGLEKEMLVVRGEAFREIRSRTGPEQEAAAALIARLGGRVVYRYAVVNMLAAVLPAESIGELAALPEVTRIDANEPSSVKLVVSARSIGAPVFWDAGLNGAGESVAVLDTGVKLDHPSFANIPLVHRVFLNGGSASPCFNDQRTSPNDLHGHGTHVNGIVANRGAAGWSSYAGVARGLGLLYNLKVAYRKSTASACANQGNYDAGDVMAAFDWAIQNAPLVKVFNFSAGADAQQDDDVMARLFDFLADTYDLTIIVAGGNESKAGYAGPRTDPGVLATPGIAYNVLTVGSMNTNNTADRSDDQVSIFSSRGPTKGGRKKPDLVAPGGMKDDLLPGGWQAYRGIFSTAHDSPEFVAMAGTSMAAPHVAGAAALLRQAGIRDPRAIKAVLLNSADSAGWDASRGWGYVNLERAFEQRDHAVAGAIPRGAIRRFKGSVSGAFQATLAWNRSVDAARSAGCLSNLNLVLYNVSTGAMISSSNSWIDNVEQVRAVAAGELMLAVHHPEDGSCRDSENFGLALSQGGFEPVSNAVLDMSCEFPSQTAPSSQLAVSCTVRNTGGLPAFGVTGALTVGGSQASAAQVFGAVAPGDSVTRTWTLTAPDSAGVHELRFTAESSAFDMVISGSSSYSFATSPSSTGCTITLSSTSAEVPASGASVTVLVSAPPGCSWAASRAILWASFEGSAQGAGSGSVTLQVAANTGSSPRAGTVNIGGRTFTIRQEGLGAGPQQRRVLPQMAFGTSRDLGTWSTELYLYNRTGGPVQASVSFFAEDGSPLAVPKWGAAYTLSLAPRGTAMLDLTSPGALAQGSIHLDLPEGVSGYGVLRQSSAGLNPQEGVIPFSSSTSAQSTILFDETNSVTAVAICNPGAAPVVVSATGRDASGTSLGSFTLNLGPKQRIAFALRERPELHSIVGKRGSVEFRATGGVLSVLGLRFNSLAFTSILPLEQ